MQVLCGLQVVFFLFNCQTPEFFHFHFLSLFIFIRIPRQASSQPPRFIRPAGLAVRNIFCYNR